MLKEFQIIFNFTHGHIGHDVIQYITYCCRFVCVSLFCTVTEMLPLTLRAYDIYLEKSLRNTAVVNYFISSNLNFALSKLNASLQVIFHKSRLSKCV